MALTHYTASNGQAREIATMATPHLANAVAKMQREEPHRVEEINALQAEFAKRPDAADFTK